jgi:transposase
MATHPCLLEATPQCPSAPSSTSLRRSKRRCWPRCGARYGYLLALHILLLCAAGRRPTDIAAVLFCSRSNIYRAVRAYQTGTLDLEYDVRGRLIPPIRTTVLVPTLRRSLLALLKAPLRAYGWCRTRWSCATLALTLQAKRGMTVSAGTTRRWLHELGWVWKRAKLVARDDDPQRIDRLARIRYVFEQLKPWESMVFADELDIHLLPKVGCAWMPKGTPLEVMTPGQNRKHSLAGALELTTGTLHHGLGPRKTNVLFGDLLAVLDARYPAERYTRLYVVVDNYKIHKAKAVEDWLAAHPRFSLLFLPTYCPRAHPIERAFGDVHDCCTRNHQRKRLPDLVAAVVEHLQLNGPWKYQLSALYYEPAVTAAVEKIAMEEQAKAAA